MNRVWKQFFKNLAWPVGFAAYLFTVVIGAEYANMLFEGAALIVVVLFICIPVAVFLIRDMWRDAKQKVEWENEQTMRALKGE